MIRMKTAPIKSIEALKTKMIEEMVNDKGIINQNLMHMVSTIQKIPEMFHNDPIEEEYLKKIIKVFVDNPLDVTATNVPEIEQKQFAGIDGVITDFTNTISNTLNFNRATDKIPIENGEMPTTIDSEIQKLEQTHSTTRDDILSNQVNNILTLFTSMNQQLENNLNVHSQMVFNTGRDVFYTKMLYLLLINNELAYDYQKNISNQTRDIIVKTWMDNLIIMSEVDYSNYFNEKLIIYDQFQTRGGQHEYVEQDVPNDSIHQSLCVNTVNDADEYIKSCCYRPQAVRFFSEVIKVFDSNPDVWNKINRDPNAWKNEIISFGRVTRKLGGYSYGSNITYRIFNVLMELLNRQLRDISQFRYLDKIKTQILSSGLNLNDTFLNLFRAEVDKIDKSKKYPLSSTSGNRINKFILFNKSVTIAKITQYSCMDLFWIINVIHQVTTRSDKVFDIFGYIDAFKIPISGLKDYAKKQFSHIENEFPNFVLLVDIFYNYVNSRINEHLHQYIGTVQSEIIGLVNYYKQNWIRIDNITNNNDIYNDMYTRYIRNFLWVFNETQPTYPNNPDISFSKMDNFNDNIIYRLILPFGQFNDKIREMLRFHPNVSRENQNIKKWDLSNGLIDAFKKKIVEISKKNSDYPKYINDVIDKYMIQNDNHIQNPNLDSVYTDPEKTINDIYGKLIESTDRHVDIVKELINDKDIRQMINVYCNINDPNDRFINYFKELLKNLDEINFQEYSRQLNDYYQGKIWGDDSMLLVFKMIDYYGGLLSSVLQFQMLTIDSLESTRQIIENINNLIKIEDYLNIPQEHLPRLVSYIIKNINKVPEEFRYIEFPLSTSTQTLRLISTPLINYLQNIKNGLNVNNNIPLKNYHNLIIDFLNRESSLKLVKMIQGPKTAAELFDNYLLAINNIEKQQILDKYRIGEINYCTVKHDSELRDPVPGRLLVDENNEIVLNDDAKIGIKLPLDFRLPDEWKRGMPPSIRTLLSDHLKLLKQLIVDDIIDNPFTFQKNFDEITNLNPELSDQNKNIFVKNTIGKIADDIIVNIMEYSFHRVMIYWVEQMINGSKIPDIGVNTALKVEYINILTTKLENKEMNDLLPKKLLHYKLNYIEQNPTKMDFISGPPNDKFIHYLYNINYFSDNNIDEPEKKCYQINPKIIKMLITSDTINAQNADGNTPLHFAVDINHHGIARLLVNHGAKQITNNKGVSPINTAINNIRVHLEFIKYQGTINKALGDFSRPFNDSLMVSLRSDIFRNNVLKNVTLGVPIQLVIYNHMFHVYTVNHRYGITPELTNDIGIIINGNQPFIFPYDKIILGERLLTYPYDLFDITFFNKVNKDIKTIAKENMKDVNKRKIEGLKKELKRINNEISGYKAEFVVDQKMIDDLGKEKVMIEEEIKKLKPIFDEVGPVENDNDFEYYYRLIMGYIQKNRRETVTSFYVEMEDDIKIRRGLENVQMLDIWKSYLNKTISNTETMIFFRIHNIINKLITFYPPKSMKIYQKYLRTISKYMETVKNYIEMRNNLPQNLDDNPPLKEQFEQLVYLINLILTPSVVNIFMGELIKTTGETNITHDLSFPDVSEKIEKYLHEILPLRIIKFYTKIYDNDQDPVKQITNDADLFGPILKIIKTNSIIIFNDDNILIKNMKTYLIPFLMNTYDNFIRTIRTSIYGYERYLLNTYQLTNILSGIISIN